MLIIDEAANVIRNRRREECFPIINRGKLWYNRLSRKQLQELDDWYQKWLDATETKVIPEVPSWIFNKLEGEEIV